VLGVSDPSDPSRPRVAILFGGRSSEHAISCVTAGSVLGVVDRGRWDVRAVGITRDGVWVPASDDPEQYRIVGSTLPEVTPGPHRLVLRPDGGSAALVALPAAAGQEPVDLGRVDVVLPLLHGPYGEDGTVQGLLEMAGVRYVGSGVLASAAAMDKHVMKSLLAAAGLPVCRWVRCREDRWAAAARAVTDEVAALGWPVFVKPARAGSSMGISRVSDEDALPAAMAEAFRHDPWVLVEQAVVGREVECGVLDGWPPTPGRRPEVSVPGEIVVQEGRAFYDFDAKYLDPQAVRLDVPAELDETVAHRVRDLASAAYEALGCEGLARVDTFCTPDGQVLVNEVNTMPGFTPSSMFPMLWQASGLGYGELVDRLLTTALARPLGLR
jgi:D-alanine-D-alanine ligase